MTIASEIKRIENNIKDTYTAAENKGATLPEEQNSDNLAQCINTITTGTPINNQDITVQNNGTYSASQGYTGLGTVTVNVPSGDRLSTAIPYKIATNGSSGPSISQYGIVEGLYPIAYLNYPFLIKNSNWELILNASVLYQGSYEVGPWYLCSITNKFTIFAKRVTDTGRVTIRLGNYINNYWNADYTGVTILDYETYYYFKLTFNKDTSDLTLYTSTDGITYTQELQIQKNEDMSGILNIGCIPFLASDSKNMWCGRMDLSKSSLKIENKTYPFFIAQ